MIYNTAFEYCNHFLQTVVSFLSCPVGVLFLGLIVAIWVVLFFDSLRR